MNKYIIFITSTVLKFVLIAVLSLNLTKLTNRTNFIFVFLYVLNVLILFLFFQKVVIFFEITTLMCY